MPHATCPRSRLLLSVFLSGLLLRFSHPADDVTRMNNRRQPGARLARIFHRAALAEVDGAVLAAPV